MLHRNALSVLPEPVGATTSACRPAPMASHAPACAGVGSANAAPNQVRVASLNRSSGAGTGPSLLTAPTAPRDVASGTRGGSRPTVRDGGGGGPHTGARGSRAAYAGRPLPGAARLSLRAALRRRRGRGPGGADALRRRGPAGRAGRAAAARPAHVV